MITSVTWSHLFRVDNEICLKKWFLKQTLGFSACPPRIFKRFDIHSFITSEISREILFIHTLIYSVDWGLVVPRHALNPRSNHEFILLNIGWSRDEFSLLLVVFLFQWTAFCSQGLFTDYCPFSYLQNSGVFFFSTRQADPRGWPWVHGLPNCCYRAKGMGSEAGSQENIHHVGHQ